MGRQDNLLNLGKEYRLGFPVPLTVIATSDQIDALQAAKGAPWIADANLIALELDQEITDLTGAALLFSPYAERRVLKKIAVDLLTTYVGQRSAARASL